MSKVTLAPKQLEFLNCKEKTAGYIAGIGAGKSFVLALWIITTSLKYPKSRGLIAANTYKQLTSATLNTLEAMLQQLNIPYERYGNKKGMGTVFNINGGADIFCRSLENPDSIRGIEVGFIGVDEAAFATEYSYEVILGRLRDNNGPLHIRLSSSPNGFNWVYELLVTKADASTRLIQGSSRDNKHLPKGYVETLAKQYDEKVVQQELEGAFINTTSGQMYYGFSRDQLVEYTGKVPRTIWLGIDYNVNPLTAVVGVYDGNILHIIDEFYLRDSNTYALALAITEKYPNSDIHFVGDASGKARKTSSEKTDDNILKAHGLTSHTPRSNPAIKGRLNVMNNNLSIGKILIDPKCKMLIKDLEQMTHGNKDPDLSHISDACGYLAWNKFPIKRPSKGHFSLQL